MIIVLYDIIKCFSCKEYLQTIFINNRKEVFKKCPKCNQVYKVKEV